MTQQLTAKLFSEFHSALYQNCAVLAESKPYLDDEELEEMAYEITLKQFYFQAVNFLEITRRDHKWGEQWR